MRSGSFAQVVAGTRTQGDGKTQDGLTFTECKPLQDYMMHQVVRLCIEHGIPMQIHTGLHAGNGNIITNSNPTHLVNLFIQYPQARFDIFHAGYPVPERTRHAGKKLPKRLHRPLLGAHHQPVRGARDAARVAGNHTPQQDLRLWRRLRAGRIGVRPQRDGAGEHRARAERERWRKGSIRWTRQRLSARGCSTTMPMNSLGWGKRIFACNAVGSAAEGKSYKWK